MLFGGGGLNIVVFLLGIRIVIGCLGWCGVVVKVGVMFGDVLLIGIFNGLFWFDLKKELVWVVLFFVNIIVFVLCVLFWCKFFFCLFV